MTNKKADMAAAHKDRERTPRRLGVRRLDDITSGARAHQVRQEESDAAAMAEEEAAAEDGPASSEEGPQSEEDIAQPPPLQLQERVHTLEEGHSLFVLLRADHPVAAEMMSAARAFQRRVMGAHEDAINRGRGRACDQRNTRAEHMSEAELAIRGTQEQQAARALIMALGQLAPPSGADASLKTRFLSLRRLALMAKHADHNTQDVAPALQLCSTLRPTGEAAAGETQLRSDRSAANSQEQAQKRRADGGVRANTIRERSVGRSQGRAPDDTNGSAAL